MREVLADEQRAARLCLRPAMKISARGRRWAAHAHRTHTLSTPEQLPRLNERALPGAADAALARREGGSNVGLLDRRRQKTGGHHAEREFVDSMVGEKFRTPRLAGNSVR